MIKFIQFVVKAIGLRDMVIRDLNYKIEALESQVFEQTHWAGVGEKKVAEWVMRHDNLLARFKALQEKYNDYKN